MESEVREIKEKPEVIKEYERAYKDLLDAGYRIEYNIKVIPIILENKENGN